MDLGDDVANNTGRLSSIDGKVRDNISQIETNADGIKNLSDKADGIEATANTNMADIPPLTMQATQNAADIAMNSEAIADLYPDRVNMASDDIAAALEKIKDIGNTSDNIPW